MTYELHVANLVRQLPLCRLNDELMIAAFVIFGDVELTQAAAKALLEKAPEYDVLITAESKGIPLAHEMARQHGDERYIVARKAIKLYMSNVFSVGVDSITTAAHQELHVDGKDAAYMKGKRVLIVDDVISTGESLRAVEHLVTAAAGSIVGRMAILAEGSARERDDILYLEPLPLFDAHGNVLE